MPVVGRGDEHGVEVLSLKEPAIVEVAVALADVFRPADAPLIDVRDGEHLDVVGLAALDEAADVAGAHAAAADDGEGNAVVGTRDGRVCRP